MNHPRLEITPEDDAIDTAAAAWLCEREEGFVPGRAEAFVAWRAADPRHDAAIERTEQGMALIAELPSVRDELAVRLAHPAQPTDRAVRWVGFRPPAWAAGVAAALALAGGLWWLQPARSVGPHRFVTAAANQEQIALNDGSVVNLNASSEVRVRLTASERHVTLAAGEAHFAVAHDPARPFIVTAAGVAVRAVGTAFNVRVGETGLEVLVTEGKVEVTRDGGSSAVRVPAPLERPQLVAGERAAISRRESMAPAKIERVSAEALRAAVRWHSAMITFYDLPLRTVVGQFNRRNERQLVLGDAAVGDRRIGGTFPADQVDAFVRLLEQDGDIVAERRGAREIVLRRAP
jgi:transmembrane sensor